VGFVCNLMIQPVAKKHYMTRAQIAEIDAANKPAGGRGEAPVPPPSEVTPTWLVAAAWAAVGIPLAWGAWVTVVKAAAIFAG
jgi:hypothetical protein